MAEDKIQAPSSSTGIMRFYDVSTSNIQIDAMVVIGFTIAIILLELILRYV